MKSVDIGSCFRLYGWSGPAILWQPHKTVAGMLEGTAKTTGTGMPASRAHRRRPSTGPLVIRRTQGR